MWRKNPERRCWSRVAPAGFAVVEHVADDGCWLWTVTDSTNGAVHAAGILPTREAAQEAAQARQESL